MLRSKRDVLNYRLTTLSNGLKVILVQDTESEKASACLRVGVGHLSDPVGVPGMAHFCEHMLFLGTRRFPTESEYKRFVSTHGGSTNAATGTDYTRYHFDVAHDSLEGGLERFSKFFVCPLFTSSAVGREVRAIENEHKRNVPSDGRRWWYVLKRTSNPLNDFHKFGTGNLSTLDRPTIRDEMMSWYRTHYSADRMTLCLVGKEQVEVLSKMANDFFGDISKKSDSTLVPHHLYPPSLLTQCQLGTVVHYRPVNVSNYIMFMFPLPIHEDADYECKTISVLENLLGHEGPGSMYHHLKYGKGFIRNVACATIDAAGTSVLQLSFELTGAGAEHHSYVTSVFQTYVRFLQHSLEAQPEWFHRFYEELKTMQRHIFDWKDPKSAIDNATSLVDRLHTYPSEDVEGLLFAPYRMDRFDGDVFCRLLNTVSSLGNGRIGVWDQRRESVFEVATGCLKPTAEFETDPYYAAEYAVYSIPDRVLSGAEVVEFNPTLPTPNPYIPSADDLAASQQNMQSGRQSYEVVRQRGLQLTHRVDPNFPIPKSNYLCTLVCPPKHLPMTSPQEFLTMSIFSRMLGNVIRKYDAELANLSYSFSTSYSGLQVSAAGFSPHLSTLFLDVHRSISDVALCEEMFRMSAEELREDLTNERNRGALFHASQRLSKFLTKEYHSHDELVSSLPKVGLSDVDKLRRIVVEETSADALIYGNFTQDHINTFCSAMKRSESVALDPSDYAQRFEGCQQRDLSVRASDAPSSYVVSCPNPNPDDVNSAMVWYVPLGVPNIEDVAACFVLSKLLHPKYFYALRTQQQLGYQVYASHRIDHNILGYNFVVVSSTHSGIDLFRHTQKFLKSTAPELSCPKAQLDDFENARLGVLKELRDPVRSVYTAAARAWREVSRGTCRFDRNDLLIEAVSCMTFESIQSLLQRILNSVSESENRSNGVLSLCERNEITSDLAAFMSSNGFVEKLNHNQFHETFIKF
eukprot:PhM_4_TR6309/c0_g1_i1/m.105132/K01408/IDE, ide; insulysin